MAGLLRIFRNKWITPPKRIEESFEGRNVIITGGTSGIGLEAAVKFIVLGASKVIIGARERTKADAVKADIERRTGTKGILEIWNLDMDSYASIIAFAERANALEHLDIAVLNAGIWKNAFVQTQHGWETDIQVNTLSNTLLGILLLPKLKESKQHTGKIPVLQYTNSGLHQSHKILPEALASDNMLQAYNSPELFKAQRQYACTKLFLMYATNRLAQAVSSGDVIISSVCPGMVMTDLARDLKFWGKSIVSAIVGFLFMRTPEQGSRTIISGIVQGETLHGRFWQHDRIQPLGNSIRGEENKKTGLRVWNEIVEALQRDVPAVGGVLKSIGISKD